MDVFLPDSSIRRGGLTQGLYDHLRTAITDGRLRPGDRVPASRQLAAEYGISRHTVTTVYGRLVGEGYLEGASGGGTRVSTVFRTGAQDRADQAGTLRARPAIPPTSAAEPGPVPRIDLRLGAPDPALFPHEQWRRRVAREMRQGTRDLGAYADPAGDPLLRAAIARWAGTSRGVRTGAERVVVTAGAQQAFDIVLSALVGPGAVVAVEDPGYPRFRDLAQLRGARVVGVPVDDEGIVVDALPPEATLVYVTPSHQFPLGCVLSLPRRLQLLRWARTHDAAIVEDDYDTELRFTGRPVEPLHLLDPDGRVLYVGTFSKTLSPALRLGYLVAPASLMPALRTLCRLTSFGGDPFTQRALAGLLADGSMAAHLRRIRRRYAPRRAVLNRHLAAELGRRATAVPGTAGLHVTLRLPPGVDEAVVVRRARQEGIAVAGLGAYAIGGNPPAGIAIGFGTVDAPALDAALVQLTRLLSPA